MFILPVCYLWQVIISDESFQDVSKLSFKITLARPALKFNDEDILALYSGESPSHHNGSPPLILSLTSSSMVPGDVKFATGLQTYLLSRDPSNLKSEFQAGDGKV